MKTNSRITTFDSLRYLLDLDETDHDMKEMATLFVDALRDWGNCQNIVKCIEDFKAYFVKQAYPNVHYQLYVVIWSSTLNISLENDTLQFLGEIGAGLANEMFALT